MPAVLCSESEEGHKCTEESMGRSLLLLSFPFPHHLISVQGVTSTQVLQICPNCTW